MVAVLKKNWAATRYEAIRAVAWKHEMDAKLARLELTEVSRGVGLVISSPKANCNPSRNPRWHPGRRFDLITCPKEPLMPKPNPNCNTNRISLE